MHANYLRIFPCENKKKLIYLLRKKGKTEEFEIHCF